MVGNLNEVRTKHKHGAKSMAEEENLPLTIQQIKIANNAKTDDISLDYE